MKLQVSAVIVTHNSSAVLSRCLRDLESQSVCLTKVIIVDSGSDDPGYLQEYCGRENYLIHTTDNIGFAAANNRGLGFVDEGNDYILFLNPDTFLEKSFVEKAIQIISREPEVAILTGVLHGYDLKNNKPSGKIDSTGVFRSWYGRWHDRGQGDIFSKNYQISGYVPAICGALMFCRPTALNLELPELFDESFFMYKEDIELCLRLREKGWLFLYTPDLKAYHCRGWQNDRKKIPEKQKLLSAKNEIKLYLKHPSPYILWAVSKYVLVKWFNV